MINIGELITDPDFAQPGGINIIRRKCEIVNHRPVPTETVLNVPGIITIASDTSVEKLPEADRSTEDIHIFTHEQLLTTGRKDDVAVEDYLSDIVVWQGVKYIVMKCMDDTQYGFCRSTATKLEQDVM